MNPMSQKVRVYDPSKFHDGGLLRTRYRVGGSSYVKIAGEWWHIYLKDGAWELGHPTQFEDETPKKANRQNTKKSGTARHSNPTAAFRRKLAEMKPGKWYDAKVSGVQMKVKRNGGTLTLRKPAKRSR